MLNIALRKYFPNFLKIKLSYLIFTTLKLKYQQLKINSQDNYNQKLVLNK